VSPSMVVLVPSRGRPRNIDRLRQAWADTGATADLVVLVDDDDPTRDEYAALDLPALHIGPRQRIGPLLNDWAPRLARSYDVVGFMGDDHVPRTQGWDALVLEASTLWTVVYGNDLLQGENLPTAVFQGAGIIRTLGQFCEPGALHLYLDNYWRTLGERLGTLRYLPDVIIEHVHYINGKAPEDALYAEVNAPSMYEHDGAAWTAYASGAMGDDLDRVRAAMGAVS